ncbi:ThiF family adenylyltransferase [Candidatus Woesearchaeota archaeon]|nr:ThiF family adenylyltransferase [Candidatus Woesearchaeota archaeon]
MTRYASTDAVKELGEDAASIRQKTATIVGLGALGSAAAEMLSRMGVNLRIIDKDRIYEQDLDKLSLFADEHTNKFKAKEAKKLLEDINPDIKVKAFHEELVENNAFLVDADVIIECSHNEKTASLVDGARKETPLIYTRAAGVKGGVLVLDDTKLSDVKGFLEKHAPESADGDVLPTTVRLTAALAVNKALKVLTGQRHEKNLLKMNGWTFATEKVTVRKDR